MHCNFDDFNLGLGVIIICEYDYPLNLALTSVTAKDPYVKTERLTLYYGKAKLDSTFIDMPVCQTLITRKIILSRYFIQKLLIHLGKYDQKLNELKIEHNAAGGIRIFQQKIKSSWARNFPYLLLDKRLSSSNEDIPSKELFHFLSVVINYAPCMLINKRFMPFPPRPKALQLDLNSDPHIHQRPIPEEHSSKDFYINNKPNVLKSFDFLQKKSFLRQCNRSSVLTLFTNNVEARPSRSISQGRQRRNQLRRQRNINRIYQRHQPINNQDTLNRIANLPQQITNDQLINQFFNGSLFI